MAHKPAAKMRRAKPDVFEQTSPPDRGKELEQDEANENPNERQSSDELSVHLSTDYYIHPKSWHWFFRPIAREESRLSVDRYYPTLSIAIDLGNTDQQEVDIKRRMLKEHRCSDPRCGPHPNGIKYENLVEGMHWHGLVEALSRQ